MKKALSAGFDTDDTPVDGINYLDIHDNWALADRFAIENWDGRYGVHEERVKIAATLLFSSLGPVVIHGGTEILRSKGHAPLEEIVKKYEQGNIYIHGKRDTYNLARANEFEWEKKGAAFGEEDGTIKCNYDNMYNYWRELIELRKSDRGKVFRIRNKPEKDYYQWLEPQNTRLLGYTVNEQIFIVINTDTIPGSFKQVKMKPDQDWKLIGTINEIKFPEGITDHPYAELRGGSEYNIETEGESLYIWMRK